MSGRLNDMLTMRNSVLSKFDYRKVSQYFNDPVGHEKELRGMSNYFYTVNAQYKMIINHFSNMPVYSYELNVLGNIDDYAPNKVKQKYLEASQYIDKLNLKHEMISVLRTAMKEDVFYGYEHETKDSYFIQRINPDWCTISSIEDGVFNFAFNFQYFDLNPNDLPLFPREFQEKYQQYKTNPNEKFIELDSKKTVCFKINEDLYYPLPPFNVMFESIFDLDEYKKLKKAKAKIDNFLLLVQKIPMGKDDKIDNFLLDLEYANQFHENTSANLPDGVGLTTTPMEIERISLQNQQANSRDSVNEAIRDIYTDSGTPQGIFNAEKNTSVGISKSIMKDEQIIFSFYRQVERWLNRKIKRLSGPVKFSVKIIDFTSFSKDEEFERTLKGANNASPNIFKLGAIQGMSPNEMYNKAVLENEIFNLHDLIKPIASSHTQPSSSNSSDSEDNGRPTASDDEVTESTESWRESNDSRDD